MRKIAWAAAVLVALFLSSCGLFQGADPKPASDALLEMQRVEARVRDRIEQIIQRIADANAQTILRGQFSRDWEAIDTLHRALLAWVDSVGRVDWKALYDQIRKAGKAGES